MKKQNKWISFEDEHPNQTDKVAILFDDLTKDTGVCIHWSYTQVCKDAEENNTAKPIKWQYI